MVKIGTKPVNTKTYTPVKVVKKETTGPKYHTLKIKEESAMDKFLEFFTPRAAYAAGSIARFENISSYYKDMISASTGYMAVVYHDSRLDTNDSNNSVLTTINTIGHADKTYRVDIANVKTTKDIRMIANKHIKTKDKLGNIKIPAVIFYYNGQIVARFTGYSKDLKDIKKTSHEIKLALKKKGYLPTETKITTRRKPYDSGVIGVAGN